MDNILNEIDYLKEKIDNEIELLSYYKELSYVCDKLKDELVSHKYSLDNVLSMKKYKAFLEVFLTQRIGYINKLIVDKNNNSIFDNRNVSDLNKLSEIKEEISSLLKYIEDNFPVVGEEVLAKYEKINDYYEKAIFYTIRSTQRKFNMDINIKKEPILSIYSDTSSVLKAYINSLTAFKVTHVDNIKIFVDNDIIVKDLFKRAYDTIKEPKALEAVRKLELGYQSNIQKCLEDNNLCANTDILLVQENMIKNGLQIDKIIAKEKEKNNYYQLIVNMTFADNDVAKLLEIEEYVNSNHIYEEEFYKVLYASLEKEKYLNIKCGTKPIIYEKLSEKSKIVIEKMFLQNIKNLNEDLREEMVINLKRNGYINVLDKLYEDFFDTKGFIIKSTYNKKTIDADDELECKQINKGIIEPHFNIIKKSSGKVIDRIFNSFVDGKLLINYGDIYQFSCKRIKSTYTYDYYSFYTKDGHKIKPFKDKSRITNRILDLYIVENNNTKIATDLDFNLVFDFKNFSTKYTMLVDNLRKNILISDKGCLYLYDEHFHEIKRVKVSEIIGKESMFKDDSTVSVHSENAIFNDGIIPLNIYSGTDRYICYYDIINMRIIDAFTINVSSYAIFGYSEGLYNYKEKKGMMGYKNINGDVIIKPEFAEADPFLNGCALAFNLHTDKGFIDYQGNFKRSDELIGSSHTTVSKNEYKPQYEVFNADDYNTYIISAENNYNINCNDKIIDIYLNNLNDKGKTLRK